MNFRRAVETALALGGLWGFIEVAFVYATGYAPAADAAPVMLAPMAVFLLYHAVVLLLARLRPHATFDLLLAAAVLLPPVLLFLRGRGQRAPQSLLAGLVPVGLGLLLLFFDRRHRSDRGWMTPARLIAVAVTWFGAALAFALRTQRRPETSIEMWALAVLWCGGMTAVVAGLARMARRPAGAVLLAICAGSFALAWQRSPRPPSYRSPAVRSSASTPAAGAPNVLLIVLDTVRADHLDLYGYSRPTFALTGRYLRDGLVFNRAVASGTFSLTSHGSLFTGRLPSAHGARPVRGGSSPYGRLRPEVETMASFLRTRGYRTAGVSANATFLAEWTGLQRGFDVFSATSSRNVRFTSLAAVIRTLSAPRRRPPRPASSWTAAQVTNAAIDLVNQGDEPFFLFLNYFDAHEPRTAAGSPPWFDATRATAADVYDTRISLIDAEVSRLLLTLEQRGRLDHTLLIVTADHGEYFGEHKLRSHPPMVFEPGTHVPLALRLPGVVAPGRTERRTGLHEVFQIVRDSLAGSSLDWLRSEDPTPRILTEAWSLREIPKSPSPDRGPSTTVVYAGNLKLAHRLSGKHTLFNLVEDPGEEHNLIDSRDPEIMALKDRMLREVGLRPVKPPGAARPLSEEALERLRALGYLR